MKKQYSIRLSDEEKKTAINDASRFDMDFTSYIRYLISQKHQELLMLKNGRKKEIQEVIEKSIWNPELINPDFMIHTWIIAKRKLNFITAEQAEKEKKAWELYYKEKKKNANL